ncbi:hypothetical protein V6N12_008112 [Hibiscus sabdariffa]|uniref:Uncharacterized protein n=1 Tax=Hibiscus sabdariffa TaxID=183260 RepID=A0ABR2BSZ6_9ROSI
MYAIAHGHVISGAFCFKQCSFLVDCRPVCADCFLVEIYYIPVLSTLFLLLSDAEFHLRNEPRNSCLEWKYVVHCLRNEPRNSCLECFHGTTQNFSVMLT